MTINRSFPTTGMALHIWTKVAFIVAVFCALTGVSAFYPQLCITRRNEYPTSSNPLSSLVQNRNILTSRLSATNRNSVEENDNSYKVFVDNQRRKIWTKTLTQLASVAVGVSALVLLGRPVFANNNQRSRTTGYDVQKTESEWKELLSPMQYFVLREGGTERPKFSVLEKEKRVGVFKCAGCGTPLFESKDKFNSGTGWPSFARGLPGVEVEKINPLIAGVSGAELRCKTCGGHLGDVFNDGYIFVGTEAAVTGQRYCIDGAALLFYPTDDEATVVRGDTAQVAALPSIFDNPVIKPRD